MVIRVTMYNVLKSGSGVKRLFGHPGARLKWLTVRGEFLAEVSEAGAGVQSAGSVPPREQHDGEGNGVNFQLDQTERKYNAEKSVEAMNSCAV